MTVDQIRAQSPFPWVKQVNALNGMVRMIDARGAEVPLFSMTDFCSAVTTHIQSQQPPPQPPPAPSPESHTIVTG